MGVGVKEPVLQDLFDDHPGCVEADAVAVVSGRVQRGDVVYLDAANPLHHQHPAGSVLPVDLRDVKIRLVGEIGPEPVGIVPLAVEIQFRPQGGGEFLHDARQVVEFSQGSTRLQKARHVRQNVQVHVNGRLYVGALDLDDDLRAVG
jgi:hypothetical protein